MLTFTIGNRELRDMTPAEFEDLCKVCKIDFSKIYKQNGRELKSGDAERVYMHPTLNVVGSFYKDGSCGIRFEVESDEDTYGVDDYGDFLPIKYDIGMGEVWEENYNGVIEPLKVVRWFMENGFAVYEEE